MGRYEEMLDMIMSHHDRTAHNSIVSAYKRNQSKYLLEKYKIDNTIFDAGIYRQIAKEENRA